MAYNAPPAWQPNYQSSAAWQPPPMSQSPPDVPVFPRTDVVQNGIGQAAFTTPAPGSGPQLFSSKSLAGDTFTKTSNVATAMSDQDNIEASQHKLNSYMQRMQIDPSAGYGVGPQQHPPPPVPPSSETTPLPSEPSKFVQVRCMMHCRVCHIIRVLLYLTAGINKLLTGFRF
ncbi:unnamed protein product [Soboliphyme baturini]|uniref:ADP-ribosylation factor GTPase-activating protein AGD5 n=1 Tax=Soboliphyme baturini TaxID=241478 RepID=A0A183J2G8_9BILA|nr:unnamed protein product [Soboliphyme baturini]